ncbi:MAG: hypothetical protein ACOYEQ_05800 [Bacillota bacterium]|jgi:predicted nucleic acid-binding protein
MIDPEKRLAKELAKKCIDTAYLTVAEREQCEMWTADALFVRAASGKYPFVRFL